MTVLTAADITGDDAVHVLGSAGLAARRIWITAHGSSNARFGDEANVGSSRGVALSADVQYSFSVSDADLTDRIGLNTVAVYVPTGTTVSYTWGV